MVLKCSRGMVKKFENVAYLFDLFCLYEAEVVTEIPKTSND